MFNSTSYCSQHTVLGGMEDLCDEGNQRRSEGFKLWQMLLTAFNSNSNSKGNSNTMAPKLPM